MIAIAPQNIVTRPALRYYGAKWRLAPWIIAQFPPHTCYVEPFGGSGGVLLRKEPSAIEVYNDADGEVVNFFRVLRDQRRELLRAVRFTPFARAEWLHAYEPTTDPVEWARRYFIRAWQQHGGPRQRRKSGWKIQKRMWESSRADQITEWNKAKGLAAVANRMLQVQIECDDALRVIRRFDAPSTLFYCDPPYPKDSRNARWAHEGYTCEVEPDFHLHLCNLLNRIQGMAVVSSYPNELYDELLAGWTKLSTTTQTMNKTIATECLWLAPRVVGALEGHA